MDSGYESDVYEPCLACRREEKLMAAINYIKQTYANLEVVSRTLGDQEEEKKFNSGYNICIKYIQHRCVECFLEDMCIAELEKDLYSIKNLFPNSVRLVLGVWERLDNGNF